MASKANGSSAGHRRPLGPTLAPIVRGSSTTKITNAHKGQGPTMNVVDDMLRAAELPSSANSSAADTDADQFREDAQEVTSSVAETDDIVDLPPSRSLAQLTASASKSRITSTSPRLVDLASMLAIPMDKAVMSPGTIDIPTSSSSSNLHMGSNSGSLIMNTSNHSSLTMSKSKSTQILSPASALLLKVAELAGGSGSARGGSGSVRGGCGSARGMSPGGLLMRVPSKSTLLSQQNGSSKRMVEAVGKVLHQMTPSQEGARQSIADGAAAVARKGHDVAAAVSKRFSLLRADTTVNAEELEHELNDMAASHVSKLAQQQQAPYCISIHSKAKMGWDAVVAVVTLYAVVVVPMDLSFNLWDAYTWFRGVQGLVDVIFSLDILVAFRTSFLISATHEEVMDINSIRRHYLTLWFWVDCVGTIPSSVLGDALRLSDFTYLRLLVFLRILRLSSSPTFSKAMSWASRTFTSYGVRMGMLMFMYLLLHHYVACSFYLLVDIETRQVDPTVDNIWAVPFQSNDTLGVKYLSSYYRGLVVTSGSDLGPVTRPERVWGTVMFTVGIIANACVAGICASVLAQMNKVQDEQVQRQDSIDVCLRNCHATNSLTSKINLFYNSAHSHESAHHASDLFHGMPEKLHFELSVALNQSFLKKVPLFRALEPEGIVALMECVEETVAMPGDVIIRAGEAVADVGRAFYMIKMGSVEVYDNMGPQGSRVSIKHMLAGEFFGEMSLIRQGNASANVVATSFCVLLVLYKEVFHWITMENEHLKSFMERSEVRRSNEATEARHRSHVTMAEDVAKATQGLIKRRNTFVPRRMAALIARIRMRRAARWVMMIQRVGLTVESMDSSSRQNQTMSRHFVQAEPPPAKHMSLGLASKMRTLMHANRCRNTATRALRAVNEMSQYTAKEMVVSTRIKMQHM
ncbi:hypothetical protein DYB37_011575 [Aphanomyces astaci]|uniref:Cyclic nucleotide-binding domain-containing protein n=2 Tax=Aphanomyces astaci TaxID=112090 RepID=A0A3R6X0U9_APHAT|nr:hypothetical protein DYB35_009028 [Aphanomyces astaci]RHZ05840.1 hypothetical protein DYB37_011575 [Aphanomyces astaci]